MFGSNTFLTSFVNCATELPTVPLFTTNDFGTFDEVELSGAAFGAGLMWVRFFLRLLPLRGMLCCLASWVREGGEW